MNEYEAAMELFIERVMASVSQTIEFAPRPTIPELEIVQTMDIGLYRNIGWN
jgi:hypothetical protein